MATRTISNAGGTWNSTAAWVEGAVPTAADDVVATATSGSLVVDGSTLNFCRSIDLTNLVATFSVGSNRTLNIGSSTPGPGNVALKFSSGMTFGVGGAGAAIILNSTSSTQQTISTFGKSIPLASFTINAVGGSYILTDAFNGTSACTFSVLAGSFHTGNFSFAIGNFSFLTGALARSITLGSSSVTCTSQFWGLNGGGGSATGLTFSAASSTVTFSASSANFNGGGQTYGTVIFQAGSSQFIYGANTYQTLTLVGNATTSAIYTFDANQIVTGTFTATGNTSSGIASNRFRALICSTVMGTARTISAGAVSFVNIDFQDINAAGAVIPWSGTVLGDALGNSNITFAVARTLYKRNTGAALNWSGTTTWSLSSGGSAITQAPLPQDTVILDANSGTATLSVDSPRMCKDFICASGFAGTVSFVTSSSNGSVFGSVTFVPTMTIGGTIVLTFAGRSAHTITSAGKVFPSGITLNGPGSVYELQDTLSAPGSITLVFGTFKVDANIINCSAFISNATSSRSLHVSGAIFNVSGTGNVWFVGVSSLVIAGTGFATLNILDASAASKGSAGFFGGLDVVIASGGTGIVSIPTGSNAYRSLTVYGPKTVYVPDASRKTLINFTLQGSPGNLVTLRSTTGGTRHSFAVTNKPNISYADVQDSDFRGATARAVNSINSGNNSGWDFRPVADLVAA